MCARVRVNKFDKIYSVNINKANLILTEQCYVFNRIYNKNKIGWLLDIAARKIVMLCLLIKEITAGLTTKCSLSWVIVLWNTDNEVKVLSVCRPTNFPPQILKVEWRFVWIQVKLNQVPTAGTITHQVTTRDGNKTSKQVA